MQMRTLLIVCSSLTLLAACASTPEPKADSKPATSAAPAKGPQCYSGDASKFFNVGEKATVSGVNVSCEATSDGKSASWMGVKK